MAMGHRKNEHKRSRSKKLSNESSGSRLAYARPYLCPHDGCTKSFTRAEHLKRHQLNHDSTKTWECVACGASFVRKDLWQRHLKVAHDMNESYHAAIHSNSSSHPEISGDSITSPSATMRMNPPSPAPVSKEPGTSAPWLALHVPSASEDAETTPADKLQGIHGYSPPDLAGEFDDALWQAPFDASWVQEMEEWRSDVHTHQSTKFTDTDIQWFVDNQPYSDLSFDPDPNVILPGSPSSTSSRDTAIISAEIYNVNWQLPPVYLQDLQSKIFVAETGVFEAPTCGFRICNALTDERRIELLIDLRNLVDVDLQDPIFSLNSMKQGIHLFFRNVNIEYSFLHHEILIASSRESRQTILDVFGGEPGPQLSWVVITLGWALMKSNNNHEMHMASRIQRAIRNSIINVRSLALERGEIPADFLHSTPD